MSELNRSSTMSSIDNLPMLGSSSFSTVNLSNDEEDEDEMESVVSEDDVAPIQTMSAIPEYDPSIIPTQLPPIEDDTSDSPMQSAISNMSSIPEYDPSAVPTTLPSTETDIPIEEDTGELDPRLQYILDNTDYEAIAETKTRQREIQVVEYNQRPDVIAQKDAYDTMFFSARNEDEITGGNRAAMIQKPPTMENVPPQAYVEQFKKSLSDIDALLNDPNPLRASATSAMLDKGIDPTTINYIITGADFVPVMGTVMGIIDVPENLREANKLWQDGNEAGALAYVGLSVLEIASVGYGTTKVAKAILKTSRKVGGTEAQMAKILDADATELKTKRERAAKAAKANNATAQQLIDEFELSTGKTISTGDVGKKILNVELAKTGGREIAQTVMDLQNEVAGRYAAIDKKVGTAPAEKQRLKEQVQAETGVTETQAYTGVSSETDDFVSPLMVPEKFNGIVAVASELKKAHPEFFSKDKSIIDSLFELTVNKDLVDSQDLADMLGKYALNFDDYVLTVVGSGSEAGKILNKLSQIRRAGSLDAISLAKQRTLEKSQNGLMQTWRRIENMRRGGMVSMVKTAARNLQSAAIRAPLEAMENVFDTTLLNMSNEFAGREGQSLLNRSAKAMAKGATSLVSPSNWKGSTRALQRIFTSPIKANEITDYVLDRPEFQKQFSSMFDNINEYQTATGRGKGGAVDGILSKGEDVVNMLNIPNRIQEFVIRRGVFMGELERLVTREYGVDLLKVLEDGGMADLMANSSKFRPKGAPKFAQLVEDSTRRALDVTYAKAPDVPVFSEIANFLTRTGLTAVTTPFPRFMFNAIELMGQYSAGAFNPAIKRALGMKKGPLDAKDRQNISRNLSGITAFTAAYMYRNSEGAPADYKEINSKEGTVVDVTSQYPMRQFLWMAEAVKRLSPGAQKYLPQGVAGRAAGSLMDKEVSEGEGTFNDWFDGKEAAETFLGASARTGASNVFIDEIANLLSGADDLVADERKAKAVGRLIGDYLTTWAIPLTQIVEVQRMAGMRPEEYKDMSKDDSPTVSGEISRSFAQRGISNLFSPTEEFDNPDREFLYSDDKRREGLGASLSLGISQITKDTDYGEYLTEKGFNEFKTGSRSRLPSIRRVETKLLKQYLPYIVENAKVTEVQLRKEYRALPKDDPTRENYTVEQYVNSTVRAMLDTQIADAKSLSRDDRKMDTAQLDLLREEFRNMSPKLRTYAMTEFFKDGAVPANMVDIEDLVELIERGKAFKGAVSIK